jgi:hypothetical protein
MEVMNMNAGKKEKVGNRWAYDLREPREHIISGSAYDDPEICRSCGKTMKIIAAIAREQGDVIERVLRHLGLWDPPWKRKRKIRGPPPSSRAGSTSSASDAVDAPSFEEAVDASEGIDPGLDDDLYAIDPVPREDDDTQA